MGLCFNRREKISKYLPQKSRAMIFWGSISKFKIITFRNLPGADIRKSNHLPLLWWWMSTRAHELQHSAILDTVLLSFLPNKHDIAAYICIGSNEYAADRWWAVVNSDWLWATELRQKPNSLLALLCCGGLAGLWYFLEAYPKQAWSNNGLIGWRLMTELSLSSRSLSGRGTKQQGGGRERGERIQQRGEKEGMMNLEEG